MKDWKYIDTYESLPDADFIHCDTRDFHILCVEDKEYLKKAEKEIRKKFGYETLSDCQFDKEEILPMLKDLENKSGGKGSWRHLTLGVTSKIGWLKYIRFIKWNNKYLAYTTNCDEYILLSREELSSPINEEYLNHIG